MLNLLLAVLVHCVSIEKACRLWKNDHWLDCTPCPEWAPDIIRTLRPVVIDNKRQSSLVHSYNTLQRPPLQSHHFPFLRKRHWRMPWVLWCWWGWDDKYNVSVSEVKVDGKRRHTIASLQQHYQGRTSAICKVISCQVWTVHNFSVQRVNHLFDLKLCNWYTCSTGV